MTQTAYQELNSRLMKRWREKEFHQNKEFIEDGIIDFPRWEKAPKKILFLLKEAYGGDGDICRTIRDDWKGPKYKIFWTAAYWLYAINKYSKNLIPDFPKSQEEVEECVEYLLASAIINVKKSGGKSRSNFQELQAYAAEDS